MRLSTITAALFAAAGLGLAQAETIFSEGFEDVASLTSRGWDIWNRSEVPFGPGWFQGSLYPFEGAATGEPSSYAAANYLGTVTGALSTWLVTPAITLTGNDTLGFALRAVGEAPWADSLRVFIADGSATSPEQFTTQIFDMAAVPPLWIDIQPQLPTTMTTVRIAFEYYGTFAGSNYMGLDNVRVTSAVPEAGTAAMLALGLAGLALRRRSRA